MFEEICAKNTDEVAGTDNMTAILVKLFNDNFQAAGDTLIYKTIDSTIYITKNAFLWQSKSQLSGLKLFIYLVKSFT